MKISIIIPIYNAENTIKKLIETILKQTYNDYEIILVDDGSKDNSLNLIKEIAKKDKRIKVFSKENEGPGLARKYGYLKSSGDLLFFIDADDWLYDETVLGKINDTYLKYKFEILLFNCICIIKGKSKILKIFRKNNIENKSYEISKLENMEVTGALWGKIFVKIK